MKKTTICVLCLVCALVILLGTVCVCRAYPDAELSAAPEEQSSSVIDLRGVPTGTTASATADGSDRRGRDVLRSMQKSAALLYVYDAIERGIASLAESVSVEDSGEALKPSEVFFVCDLVRRDHGEFFWFDTCSCTHVGDRSLSVNFKYNMSLSEIAGARARFDAESKRILSGLVPSMSELDAELYIHDALCELVNYDHVSAETKNYAPHCHDAYGAIVLHSAVCDGYTKAFQSLLRRAGIVSFRASGLVGENGRHAWNYVKIDGEWYQTDVTWDDPGDHPSGDGSNLTHKYFNLTDAVMGENHTPQGEFPYPVCTSVRGLYANVKSVVLGKREALWSLRGFDSLESVDVPLGVKTLGKKAFYECRALRRVELPDGLLTVGDYAFAYCASLESISIPDSVESVGKYPFYECSSLAEASIGDGVTSLGDCVFYKCFSLKRVTLGDGLRELGENLFYGNEALESVGIGRGVSFIDGTAFARCTSLCTIDYAGGAGEWAAIDNRVSDGRMSALTVNFGVEAPAGAASEGSAASGALAGDVNGDGKFNAKDVSALMTFLVGSAPAAFVASAADVDGDGKVNSKDVTVLMKFLVR